MSPLANFYNGVHCGLGIFFSSPFGWIWLFLGVATANRLPPSPPVLCGVLVFNANKWVMRFHLTQQAKPICPIIAVTL